MSTQPDSSLDRVDRLMQFVCTVPVYSDSAEKDRHARQVYRALRIVLRRTRHDVSRRFVFTLVLLEGAWPEMTNKYAELLHQFLIQLRDDPATNAEAQDLINNVLWYRTH